ncbi:hypothetical protein ACHAW6_007413 [Cyclotella cf. meneghiniana]
MAWRVQRLHSQFIVAASSRRTRSPFSFSPSSIDHHPRGRGHHLQQQAWLSSRTSDETLSRLSARQSEEIRPLRSAKRLGRRESDQIAQDIFDARLNDSAKKNRNNVNIDAFVRPRASEPDRKNINEIETFFTTRHSKNRYRGKQASLYSHPRYHESSSSFIASSLNKRSQNKHTPNADAVGFCNKLRNCITIGDTVQLAVDNLDALSPRDTEKVWKHMSTLLGKSSRNTRQHQHATPMKHNEKIEHQLSSLFQHTLIGIETCHPSDLSFIAYALANVIKALPGSRHVERCLNSLLLDISLWEMVQIRSISVMDSLGPKALVSLAWAFATVSQPLHVVMRQSLDVTPFFRGMELTLRERKGQFTSSHLSNIAWSCMTCRVANPLLFNAISTEFVTRRSQEDKGKTEMEDLDAMTLCQLANSFAKAGHYDKELFESISECSIPILSSFEARNFSNLAYAFALAKMNPKCEDGATLFNEIENECMPKLHTASPQNMANLLWAYATLDYHCPDLFHAVTQEAMGRLKEFQPQHLSNVAWALSKYPPSSMEIFDAISQEVVSRGLQSFTAQGLAILAHSFATVGHIHPQFWECIEKAATQKSSEFGGIECARISWSFATIGHPADDLFKAIEKVAIANIGSFNSQGLANLAWAFSSVGYQSMPLFGAVAENFLKMSASQFKPQEMTMLILAFSRLDASHPIIFQEVISRSIAQLDKYTVLDLFNMAISYAKAGHKNDQWMVAIADEVVHRSSSDCQHMHTGMLWAYATTRVSHRKLFHFLCDALLKNLNTLDGEEIASTAWSLASLNHTHHSLFHAMAESSDEAKVNNFNTQSLANMAWAYSTAREAKPLLFDLIANAAITRNDFSPQGISNLLWAFASAGHHNERLFSSMAIKAQQSIDKFNSQAIANLAWAYAVADTDAECLFGNDAFVNKCFQKMDDFDSEGLCQLHQWNIWQKVNSANVLPPTLEKRCRDEMNERSVQHKSWLQKDVMLQLKAMGLEPNEEVLTRSGYSIDAIIEMGDNKIGIEVDGPSHFIGHNPNGSTTLKRRLVTAMDNIPLVSVPFWEWNELQSQEEKHQYLKLKLKMNC